MDLRGWQRLPDLLPHLFAIFNSHQPRRRPQEPVQPHPQRTPASLGSVPPDGQKWNLSLVFVCLPLIVCRLSAGLLIVCFSTSRRCVFVPAIHSMICKCCLPICRFCFGSPNDVLLACFAVVKKILFVVQPKFFFFLLLLLNFESYLEMTSPFEDFYKRVYLNFILQFPFLHLSL